MSYFLLLIPILYFYIIFGYYKKIKHISKDFIKNAILICIFIAGIFYLILPDKFSSEIINTGNIKTITYSSYSLNLFVYFNRLFLLSAILFSILGLFFKNCKIFKILNIIYNPIVVLINLFNIKNNLFYLTGYINYRDNFNTFSNLAYLFLLSLILLSSIIYIIDESKNKELFKDYKLYIYSIYFILASFILINPAITLVIYFNNYTASYLYKTQHYLLILFLISISLFIGYYLKRKSDVFKKVAIYTISISSLIVLLDNYSYLNFLNLSKLPITIPFICLISFFISILFKFKKLFYASYFISVFAVLYNFIYPNLESSIYFINPVSYSFWQTNTYIFIIPVVLLASGYFPIFRSKDNLISVISFSAYFVFLILVDIFFQSVRSSSLFKNTYLDVDYFYLNKDVIVNNITILKGVKENYIINFKYKEVNIKIPYLYLIVVYISYLFLSVFTISLSEYFFKNIKVYKEVFFVYKKRLKNNGRKNNLYKKIKKSLGLKNVSKLKDEILKIKEESQANLKVSNFYKSFDQSDNYTVRDVNFEFEKGDIIGFVGHNGAGKSTCIKTIVGINDITKGSITICGYDIKENPEISKYLIGYVPDNHPLYENLTGYEFIKYVASLYLVKNEDFNKRYQYFIKLFNLEKSINNYIKTYSHGMKQKISVIASLIHEPKVWILDEPLTGLDPTSVLMIKKCIIDHAKKGNIVLFSSHIIEVVENMCNKILLIKSGQIIKNMDVQKACSVYGSLTNLYKESVLG